MCNEAVLTGPLSLAYVPDRFKTQEMFNKVVHNKLCMMLFVPDHFRTKKICNETMCTIPNAFHRTRDHFKTKKMCDKVAVKDGSPPLQFVPDWFIRRSG